MTTRDVHGRGGAHGPVTLIGRGGDAADSARDFLERNGVALRWIDLERDPLGAMLPDEELRAASLPLAIFADGSRLEAPRTYIERTAGLDFSTAQQARESRHWHADLARRAGLPTHPEHDLYDVLIVGAGPAGLTAAVYAASEETYHREMRAVRASAAATQQTPGLDELEAPVPPTASRQHPSVIAVVHSGPAAALAGRPERARVGTGRALGEAASWTWQQRSSSGFSG